MANQFEIDEDCGMIRLVIPQLRVFPIFLKKRNLCPNVSDDIQVREKHGVIN
jgi:hypothetical protein